MENTFESFLVGQTLAVYVFAALGFVFLLLAMRAERTRQPTVAGEPQR